jgi:hypothetical protein
VKLTRGNLTLAQDCSKSAPEMLCWSLAICTLPAIASQHEKLNTIHMFRSSRMLST